MNDDKPKNTAVEGVNAIGAKMDQAAGKADGVPVASVGAGPGQASAGPGGYPVPGAGDNAPIVRALVVVLDRFGQGHVRKLAKRAGLDGGEIAAECALSDSDVDSIVGPAVLVLEKYRVSLGNMPELALAFALVAVGGRYQIAMGDIAAQMKQHESKPQGEPAADNRS